MAKIRMPAVAGTFYPAERQILAQMVSCFLEGVGPVAGSRPLAIVAPHAGYIYSGPVAAAAYDRLRGATVKRVLLLGPAHTVALHGLAASSAAVWQTPLGEVTVDESAVADLLTLPGVALSDAAHRQEHGLEVHLPFLQTVLAAFELVPLVVGEAATAVVAEVIDHVWDVETLVVISTDLSHFHDYETAQRLDLATAQAIEALHPEELGQGSACGRYPLRGLLQVAKKRGLRVERLALRNSGDTAGPKHRVVGYGAWAVYS